MQARPDRLDRPPTPHLEHVSKTMVKSAILHVHSILGHARVRTRTVAAAGTAFNCGTNQWRAFVRIRILLLHIGNDGMHTRQNATAGAGVARWASRRSLRHHP